jgi:hypothetical protein
VVDLAIAANFARELTEEQFAEPRRAPRRDPTARAPGASDRAASASGPAARAPSGRVTGASGPAAPARTRRAAAAGDTGRFVARPIARVLSRLAQVRG